VITAVAGRRAAAAGVVTRLLAAAVDLAVVVAASGGLVLVTAAVRFLWSPATFRWPAPPSEISVVVGGLIAFGYLAVAWTETGRTYGGALFGTRVAGRDGRPLGWIRAGARAVLCLALPIGLLWVAVSPTRRSLQDILVRSTVCYDGSSGRPSR
jgi:uncharacterized RDD family membrane protein YckC